MSFSRTGFFWIILLPVFVAGSYAGPVSSAQDSVVFHSEAERLFQEGVEHFAAGEYQDAGRVFLEIIRDFPQSHRITAALLMAAKVDYHRGAYRESVRRLRIFLDLYPKSSYLDNVYYTLGLNYYQLRRYEEAATQFLSALQTTNDRTIRSRSALWLEKLAAGQLSIGRLQLLLGDARHDEARALLAVSLAEKIFRSGDAKTAEELLVPVSRMSPTIRSVGQALELLERIHKGGVLKIGVILPLMQKGTDAAEKEVGEELLQGIKLATEEYNRISTPKVSLEIRDSERDPQRASHATEDLCTDNDIVAIVGPAHSREVLLSALIANARGVPMISPTATANGITEAGPYIFQANPSIEVRGRALAQYARTQLGARTYAILAPNDEIGKSMVESFQDEAQQLGGEIYAVQWYEPGTTDLRTQFMAIRRQAFAKVEQFVVDFSAKQKNTDLAKMLRWGISQRTLDSLVQRGAAPSVDFLFGEHGKRIADSLKIPVQPMRLKVDSLEIPVRNLDVLFVPIASAEEIGIVSSQIRYFNFQSVLLGGGEWYDVGELEQHRQYTNGIIFPTDSYWREEDENYRAFETRYLQSFGEKPKKNSLYSYDVMKALLKVLSEGARQRKEVAQSLAALKAFEGIHLTISFTEKRVNGVVSILQYKGRVIVRLGEMDIATGQFWSGQE